VAGSVSLRGVRATDLSRSPRDIDTCLRVVEPKLYHAGLRAKVSRSSLADANRAHVWQIFADFAQVLICRARKLYVNKPFGVEFDQTVYAIDSTAIDLCLSPSPGCKSNRLWPLLLVSEFERSRIAVVVKGLEGRRCATVLDDLIPLKVNNE
jgi:hypothetical protein